MPLYDLSQQVFLLSMTSNLGSLEPMSGKPADVQNRLEDAVESVIGNVLVQTLIGKWELAWGPFIFQHQGPGPALIDNAMMVFRQGDVYVVAIAATNAHSAYDWVVEDFLVHNTCPWPNEGAPAGVVISEATHIGLTKLLGMPYDYGKAGPSLAAFLAAVSNKAGSRVIFTGHSLAGALSPTLALYLFGEGGALRMEDWSDVRVLPTAGASPGNAAYNAFFAETFPPVNNGPMDVWNLLIRNTLDVVPHAWQSSTLSELPTLYGPSVPAVVVLSEIAIRWADGQYTLLDGFTFTGTPPVGVDDWDAYVKAMAQQHVDAYLAYFCLPRFAEAGTAEAALGLDGIVKGMEAGAAKYFQTLADYLKSVAAPVA